MKTIVLFDQDNVTVLLRDLYFDKEVDGVRASVEIQNRKGVYVEVVVVDLCDGEKFYDDYFSTICSVSPRKTERKEFLELNSTYNEENSILQFHNGYLLPFSFRLALFTHKKDADNLKYCSKGRKITVSKFSIDGVEIMPTESYRIDSDGEMILASAKYHIPFEITKTNAEKAQQVHAFKRELTDQIKSMEISPWNVMVAQYGETGGNRFYDIENMCIYNLGTSAFSACCPTEIAFSAIRGKDVDKLSKMFGAKVEHNCFYVYSPVLKEELERECNSKPLFADWNYIGIDTKLPNTPRKYWTSLRQQYARVCVHQIPEHPETDCFGIKVTVHCSNRMLPASLMKPLLDGIVCAFHQRDGVDNLLHTITKEAFEKVVVSAENRIAVLGKRDYVNPYRNGIKWNPADERLKFAWVSVVTEDCEPYFEGKLFAWD